MSNRLLPTGEIYHVYNRGVDKRTIFQDESDYQRFLALLYVCNGSKAVTLKVIPKSSWYTWDRGEALAQIGSFCLMPNHFHLIVRQSTERGVEKMMQKILTAYTMYFNLRNKRTGRLFENTYKAKYVESDEQLRHLLAYVHLNPISLVEPQWKMKGIENIERAVGTVKNSAKSSYALLTDNTANEKSNILSPGSFPEYFSTLKNESAEKLIEWAMMYARTNTIRKRHSKA